MTIRKVSTSETVRRKPSAIASDGTLAWRNGLYVHPYTTNWQFRN